VSDAVHSVDSAASHARSSRVLWLALPILFLALSIAWIYANDPLKGFNNGAPPVENLTFERTILNDTGIHLLVRAGGSGPLRIAQVQVDDAYWQFVQEPSGELARGSSAWVHLQYPWVLGEKLAIRVVTNLGTTFEKEIAVAVPTPSGTVGQLKSQALLGIIVGIVPVAIGLMFYPALRGIGQRGMFFLLALTIGLLAFLFVDTVEEAFEIIGEAAPLFQGTVLVVLTAAAAFLILMWAGRRRGTPTGLALASYIALGIGLHNLGEGLAIGAAFAAGSAGLGTFLVVGFAIHNITEGIGIAAPILRIRPPIWVFVALVLLAGGPAVFGMWIGSLAYAPQWSAVALAIGAGAILQVIIEVGAYLMRSSTDGPRALFAPSTMAGLGVGVAFMYLTAMVVRV
jgi:ZIP family zinc transporter